MAENNEIWNRPAIAALDGEAAYQLAKLLGVPLCSQWGQGTEVNALLGYLSRKNLLTDSGGKMPGQTAATAPQGQAAQTQVKPVMWQPHNHQPKAMPSLVGMTLRAALDQLRAPYNVAPDARIIVNGIEIKDMSTVLTAGSVLETQPLAGVKGNVK